MQASSITSSPRPSPSLVSKSFSRLDSPSRETRLRSGSGSIQDLVGPPDVPFLASTTSLAASPDKEEHSDIFSREDEESIKSPPLGTINPAQLSAPQDFDELPIEIRSLTERFLDSLSARVHPTPLSIETLADMFQDFYRKAEMHIATHVAALSSKLSRVRTSRSTSLKKDANNENGEPQQMLTAEEVTERKNQRRLLEIKRVQLEEAVERAVCEKVYMKIWHHRSAEDEEQDQKLRSRVAALSLVGIGLKDLLVSGSDDVTQEVSEKIAVQEESIKKSLEPARASFASMTMEKYPLGKLHHLNSAHKSIVETLTSFFPSSTSADEILPTLIYTLLTCPPDEINVISDLHFVQRFRTTSKIDGEAAYCLVNLEAAISFLETVELPSLRANESLAGPEKPAPGNGHKRTESVPMDLGIRAVSPPGSHTEQFPAFQPTSINDSLQPPPKPPIKDVSPRSSRRLSELIAMQANRFESASDSLRGVVRDGADQAVGAINNTLENSFRFLFGRIRATQQEQQQAAASGEDAPVAAIPVPKTLEDARKLVSNPTTPVVGPDAYDDLGIGATPLTPVMTNGSAKESLVSNTRVLDLLAGRRVRDHSTESSRSGGSGRQVSLTSEGITDHPLGEDLLSSKDSKELPPLPPTSSPTVNQGESAALPAIQVPTVASISPSPSPLPLPLQSIGQGIGQHGTAAVESMRNLTNTLNPLNQFAKIGLFGRSTSSPAMASPQAPTSAPGSAALVSPLAVPLPASSPTTSTVGIPTTPRLASTAEVKTLETIDEIRKAGAKPRAKFIDCRDSKELRLGEIEELLTEYKRVAGLLGKIMNSAKE